MDHPHVLRCLAQPRLGVGLAQESGPRLDLVPWPQGEKLSSYWGGHHRQE